jgi:hypothetical protein
LDLGVGKNEPIVLRIVVLVLYFQYVEEGVHVEFLLIAADFLEGAELVYGPFDLTGEAMAVHAQGGDGFGLVEVEGLVGDVVFEGDGAGEAPGGVGLWFGRAGPRLGLRAEVVGEGFQVELVGVEAL